MRHFLSTAISIWILTLLFNSCDSGSHSDFIQTDSQTKTFSSYLKNNFGDTIESEHHLYILIAKKDLRENISQIVRKISGKLLQRENSSYSTIISSNIQLADSILPQGKILTDWDDAIDNMKLPLTGVTLIQTSDNKLFDLLPLTTENVDNANVFLEW